MSAPLCTVCLGTGSKSQEIGGDLDCVACSAADERAALRGKLPMSYSEEIFAWRAYQLGKAAAAPVVPVAAQPVVPDAINNAFVTLVHDSGSYSISLRFNKNSDVWAVHDFLLRSGGKEYNVAAPQPAASVTDVAKDAALAIVPDWPFCNPACDYEDPHGGQHDERSAFCSCEQAKASICRQRAAIAAQQGEKT